MATRAAPTTFTGTERIVVLHGKEPFLRTAYLTALRSALSQHIGGEVSVVRFDGDSAQLADVLDEVRSMGLMDPHKLVVVDDAEEFVSRHRSALERFAASPPDTGSLVFRSEAWNKGNLDKLIAKVGHIISCEPISAEAAATWAINRARKQHKVTLDRPTATLLVEHVGCDLYRLDSEIGKLAVGVPIDGTITTRHVQQMSARFSEEKAWEIQSALLSGSARHALSKLHEITQLAQNEAIVVLFAMSDLTRKLAHASAMLADHVAEAAICKSLRIWPADRQRPFIAAARKLGVRRSAALLRAVVAIDAGAKSGLGDFDSNVERFCVQFTDALR
jgi:DNA polymerase-3 subunit delta